jgi:choice-of-anchor B domain-containing protein
LSTLVHRGWFSEDFSALYGNDELDELTDTTGNGQFPRTRIIDMTDLDDPSPAIVLFDNTAPHPSIDHNLYVKDGFIYSANYEAGSRIYKIDGQFGLEEVAFFDISDVCDDIENCFDPFGGSWTHYPYYDSAKTIGCDGFVGFYVFSPKLSAV